MSVLVGEKHRTLRHKLVLADDSIVGDYNFTDARNGKYAVVFFTLWILPLSAHLN